MGSQPIRIQLGKILQENLAKKSCGVILQENLGGKSCGKILQENLGGNYCGKFLQEIVAGKSCRTRRRGNGNLRKTVIGGNLAFGIGWWGANNQDTAQENLARKSCGVILQENLVEKSRGKLLWEIVVGNCWWKILQENLAGNYCGKFLWEIVGGKSCGKILRENLVGQGGGKKGYLRKVVIGGNLAFKIGWWLANQSRYSSEKSCGKILQGNSCRKFLWDKEEKKKLFKKGSDW